MGNFSTLLLEYSNLITFFHVAGVIVALGSVVLADLLLLWLKLKPQKADLMAKISPILSLQVWIGLFIISISGILLILPREGIENNFYFRIKMFLVLLVFINGIFLNTWITPKFNSLVPEWSKNTDKVKSFTKIAGISTAISFVAWWGIVLIMTVLY